MKNLTEELLTSFKNRIKENEELVIEVQKTLDGFKKDHQEMTNVLTANALALRKGLAAGEKERLGAFTNLMSEIHLTISSIQKEVIDIQSSTSEMMIGFADDRTEMAAELGKTFANNRTERTQNEKIRIKEFSILMKNINNDIKNINDEVSAIFKNTNDMLTRFEIEHHDMSAELRAELSRNLTERVDYTRTLLNSFQKRLFDISKENQKMAQQLRKDLASGETSRLKDYSEIMKGIHQSIKGIQKEVKNIQKATFGILDDLLNNRVQATASWAKMQNEMAQIRQTGVVTPKKETAAKTEKKKVVAKEMPVEAKVNEATIAEEAIVSSPIEMPIEISTKEMEEDQPNVESKDVPPNTLEDKVLNFINKHPIKGVKISEMEGPLGETRMKLGFIAKVLLDEGKVKKIENFYFPL
ncbi:MAG: hypothetical protein WCK18_15740 [Prolixibacteraceae bacterium]